MRFILDAGAEQQVVGRLAATPLPKRWPPEPLIAIARPWAAEVARKLAGLEVVGVDAAVAEVADQSYRASIFDSNRNPEWYKSGELSECAEWY